MNDAFIYIVDNDEILCSVLCQIVERLYKENKNEVPLATRLAGPEGVSKVEILKVAPFSMFKKRNMG